MTIEEMKMLERWLEIEEKYVAFRGYHWDRAAIIDGYDEEDIFRMHNNEAVHEFIRKLLRERKERLMACPFCGEEPEMTETVSSWSGTHYYSVACLSRECPVQPTTEEFLERDAAIGAWEKRSIQK